MKPVVFLHAPSCRSIGARLGAYSLGLRSRHADAFEVRFLCLEETPELLRYEGARFRWREEEPAGHWSRCLPNAFCLLRRLVPARMGYRGRALLLDPDILALGDVWELLNRDLGGKAIACVQRPAPERGWYTSVMLLECGQLRHWDWSGELAEVFSLRRPLGPWLSLQEEDPLLIEPLEREWNTLDALSPGTQLLHFTDRRTQPWLTGLPYRDGFAFPTRGDRWRRWLPIGERHQRHHHEAVFVDLLRQAVADGALSRTELRRAIRRGECRRDLLRLVDGG